MLKYKCTSSLSGEEVAFALRKLLGTFDFPSARAVTLQFTLGYEYIFCYGLRVCFFEMSLLFRSQTLFLVQWVFICMYREIKGS